MELKRVPLAAVFKARVKSHHLEFLYAILQEAQELRVKVYGLSSEDLIYVLESFFNDKLKKVRKQISNLLVASQKPGDVIAILRAEFMAYTLQLDDSAIDEFFQQKITEARAENAIASLVTYLEQQKSFTVEQVLPTYFSDDKSRLEEASKAVDWQCYFLQRQAANTISRIERAFIVLGYAKKITFKVARGLVFMGVGGYGLYMLKDELAAMATATDHPLIAEVLTKSLVKDIPRLLEAWPIFLHAVSYFTVSAVLGAVLSYTVGSVAPYFVPVPPSKEKFAGLLQKSTDEYLRLHPRKIPPASVLMTVLPPQAQNLPPRDKPVDATDAPPKAPKRWQLPTFSSSAGSEQPKERKEEKTPGPAAVVQIGESTYTRLYNMVGIPTRTFVKYDEKQRFGDPVAQASIELVESDPRIFPSNAVHEGLKLLGENEQGYGPSLFKVKFKGKELGSKRIGVVPLPANQEETEVLGSDAQIVGIDTDIVVKK